MALAFPLVVWAAGGVPFTVGGGADTQNISDLKHRAVLEFLQRQLGERFEQYEKQITPEFAERYIMDYKVGRAGGNRQVSDLPVFLASDASTYITGNEHVVDGGRSLW